MKNKLNNVLFITKGFPYRKSPSHCPFIGYRLAYLQKNGVHADVLSLIRLKTKDGKILPKIAKYLLVLIFPVITIEKYRFLDREYKIFRVLYGFFSRIWVPLIVFILSKFNKYSVLHYHFLWFTEELAFLKRSIKIPSVISVEGSDMHETAVEDPLSYIKFKRAIYYADKIIYVSHSLREIAKSIELATNKDIVINNGYDPQNFFLRQNNNNETTLGFVGHLYKVKGVDRLPEIFMHIKKFVPKTQLIIIGEGEQSISLKEYIKKKFSEYGIIDDVRFIGEVKPTEVAHFYGLIDILLLPSRKEGFGCVAVEARACGCPVVGSTAGGIPEAVGNGGIIVSAGEDFEKRFADAVVYLLKSLPSREEICKGVTGYSWNEIIKKEIKVYNEVLKK